MRSGRIGGLNWLALTHASAWGATKQVRGLLGVVLVSIHAPAWGATGDRARTPAFRGSFNPRARVGRDGHPPEGPARIPCFNPRARVGRDPLRLPGLNRVSAVSIHAPAWGATSRRVAMRLPAAFQSTRPRGARPSGTKAPPTAAFGFNPRARVGRDAMHLDRRLRKVVSIHAPAWGATRGRAVDRQGLKVSIHAPAWGATRIRRLRQHLRPRFNPRARVGRDLSRLLRRGCMLSFQSTRPRGARPPLPRAPKGATQRFNPRARVGRDDDQAHGDRSQQVSIHAPAWGATGGIAHGFGQGEVSIHAPAWGATSMD